MSTKRIASHAYSSFTSWASEVEEGYIPNASYLSGYIHEWVVSGEGIRACNGDFQTYLIGVITLIERWHSGQLRITRGINSDVKVPIPDLIDMSDEDADLMFDIYDDILDPTWFAECTFNTLHGRRR